MTVTTKNATTDMAIFVILVSFRIRHLRLNRPAAWMVWRPGLGTCWVNAEPPIRTEFHAAPGARQREIAVRLAEAGAGVIVGHGPHVLQPVEWVGDTVVAYSLGNFLFDEPYPLDARQGAILRVTVERGVVASVEAIPTVSERGHVRLADPDNAADVCRRLGVEACAARPLQH